MKRVLILNAGSSTLKWIVLDATNSSVQAPGTTSAQLYPEVPQIAALLGHLPPRLIVGHLGAGCSVTAVVGGRSVDTTI